MLATVSIPAQWGTVRVGRQNLELIADWLLCTFAQINDPAFENKHEHLPEIVAVVQLENGPCALPERTAS